MIVGRGRSHLVGHGGAYDADMHELMAHTGQGPPMGPPPMMGPPPGPGFHPGFHPGEHPGFHGHPGEHHGFHGHPGEHPHHRGHWPGHYPIHGAPPPGYYPLPHPRGIPVAYERALGGPHVREEHPTHPREFPIGFTSDPVPVPPAETINIEQKPQVLFRGERLAVPNSIVLNFDMADIKVGKDSQLASPGAMPTECFSNLSVGVRMQLDTAEPGITITLYVTNNADNAQRFMSVLYGTVLE
jgi:hypothetical protein